ncbi:MAG: DUF2716 domain-containing protein [Planctomycetes bacterium]|nr:DUF2716 domain-containing protein [Planctomycetota bacterium]
MVAWEEQPLDADESVRTRFERRFRFRPSTTEWPAFQEPRDSVTYSIGHAYDDPDGYAQLTLDLCRKLVVALRRCTPPGDFVDVLDWQHPSYRFWPHEPFDFESEDDWPVPALPNGDYYIFLARDLETGVLGHPWEQTMCVFGSRLLEAFGQDLPLLFGDPVRRGGKVV